MEMKESNHQKRPGKRKNIREKEYYDLLKKELESRKGENVDISFRKVKKNNGISMNACTVRYGEAKVAPTVYLYPYYRHFLDGEAVSESAENILRYCQKTTPEVSLPEHFFEKYEGIPARLGIKLICTERNRSFLEDVPHIDIEDMSAIFFYLLEELTFGSGMIVIRNADLARWGKSVEEICQDALRNCPRMLPPVFRALSDVLDIIHLSAEDGELYLLTNDSALYGASVILYPGILDEIAEYIGGSFFLLPSSIHEMIVLRDDGEDASGLLQIVADVNHTQVEREEVLTDSVYHYTPGDRRIRKLL